MKITQNREISWLQFNKRVLEEAADPRVPLLERAKFLSIFTSNLDEFYMIRCGSLYDLSLIDNTKIDKKSGMIPSEQLDAIFAESNNLYKIRDNVYKDINHTLMLYTYLVFLIKHYLKVKKNLLRTILTQISLHYYLHKS